MKLYTKESSNMVFTVKKGSDLEGLIFVGGNAHCAVEAIKEKGLSWVDQIGDDFAMVLETEAYTDNRIEAHIDIRSVDEIGDCSSVLL